MPVVKPPSGWPLEVDGVTDVKVSYAKGNAEVTFDPSKTTPGAIAKVVTHKSGFKAEPVELQKKK